MRQPRRILELAVGGAALTALLACGRPPHPAVSTAPLAPGVYRAVLTLPGGELPFGFEVVEVDGHKSVYIRNGAESIHANELEEHAGRFVLRFPGYENRIEAARDGDGYRGVAVMIRRGGHEVRLPFGLTEGRNYRFAEQPTPNASDVGGRWALTFMGKDGTPAPAIAELTQHDSHVTGTVLDPTGDHRFLEGDVVGDELRLSRFDGGSAFLYHARVLPGGTLSGGFWSGNWSHSDLSGRRDEGAMLSDPAIGAAADAKSAPFAFSFPDLDGRTVSFTDARFLDKVVVVALGGSWCPNCHDEAAFLAPLYREYRSRGLEIVYLQFEYFGDFPSAVAANRRFVSEFGINWPVLIAGTSDRDEASRKLPRLGHVYAFPTTLVLDRKGELRNVHSGFSGPATGKHYDEYRQEFTGLIESLLAEHN